MSADLGVLLGMMVALSLAMVVAMVAFNGALVAREPDSSARWRWGAVYAFTWAGIVLVMLRLPPDATGRGVPLAVVLLAPAGWAGFNAFWLRAWIALGRAGGNGQLGLPPDVDLLARRAVAVLRIGVVAVAGALWQLRVPERLASPLLDPARRAPSLAIVVGFVGFALFMAGAVRLALGGGRSRSHEEEPGPLGEEHEGSGRAEFTFEQLRDAWRTGRWRRDPLFQTAFMMFFGVAAAVGGGLAAGWALGSETTRYVLGSVVAYGVLMAWLGIRRGRKARRNQRGA
jgi:hypothetical protein